MDQRGELPYNGVVGGLVSKGLKFAARRQHRKTNRRTREEVRDAYRDAIERYGIGAAGASSAAAPSSSPTAAVGGDVDDARGIDRLKHETDCAFCQALLTGLQQVPEPERTKGVMEYGQFQGALEGGTEDEITDALRETEVLIEVVEEMQDL